MFFGTAYLLSPAWERWYFSLVDIVAALTDSAKSRDYLKKTAQTRSQLRRIPPAGKVWSDRLAYDKCLRHLSYAAGPV